MQQRHQTAGEPLHLRCELLPGLIDLLLGNPEPFQGTDEGGHRVAVSRGEEGANRRADGDDLGDGGVGDEIQHDRQAGDHEQIDHEHRQEPGEKPLDAGNGGGEDEGKEGGEDEEQDRLAESPDEGEDQPSKRADADDGEGDIPPRGPARSFIHRCSPGARSASGTPRGGRLTCRSDRSRDRGVVARHRAEGVATRFVPVRLVRRRVQAVMQVETGTMRLLAEATGNRWVAGDARWSYGSWKPGADRRATSRVPGLRTCSGSVAIIHRSSDESGWLSWPRSRRRGEASPGDGRNDGSRVVCVDALCSHRGRAWLGGRRSSAPCTAGRRATTNGALRRGGPARFGFQPDPRT